MIKITKIARDEPFKLFNQLYQKALKNKQPSVEAMAISSYSSSNKEVNCRFVNLKEIRGKEFIFYSNYLSPKSKQFKEHNQISATIFWSKLNCQIRIKATIKKLTKKENQTYFEKRSPYKNALAISSSQSNKINSYDSVKKNYEEALKNSNLNICPNYWGGYVFLPYEFEFWIGHHSRLNHRRYFEDIKGQWQESILEP